MTDDRPFAATASSSASSTATAATASPPGVSPVELAAHLAARMCHDFISPASAITSGLDLLEDPSAADMRDDAMALITTSARKLGDMLQFSRVAFGASASAETFDTRELEKLTRGVFDHVRPDLDWALAVPSVNKAAARTLLNMAQIGAGALPTGGLARIGGEVRGERLHLMLDAQGPRARLRPEVVSGLRGEPLAGGLGGHWVQAYYLNALVLAAGGKLEHQMVEGASVSLFASIPV